MTIPDKTPENLERLICDTLNNNATGISIAYQNLDAREKRLVQSIALLIRQAHDDAIEKSAQAADKLFNGFHSPHEYADDVAEAIRALKHQTKGGA